MRNSHPLLLLWTACSTILVAVFLGIYLGRNSLFSTSPPRIVTAEFEQSLDSINAPFGYTDSVPLSRLATEWEPQRALILTMSFPDSMAAPAIATFQIELLAIAHEYTDILVFSEHDHTRAHAFFLSLLEDHPQAESIAQKTHFVDSRNLMRWVRDFGPLFGFDPHNELVAIDFVYRNLNRDPRQTNLTESDSFRRFLSQQGDAMPTDLAVELRRRYEKDVTVVRPPLMLDGGDFVHDGRGNIFISSKTLVRNGGNHRKLQSLIEDYLGGSKLHVLEALPGATVNHLDMILKFVDSDTALIPSYQSPPDESLNRYQLNLTKRVREVLKNNEDYLRKNLPEVELIPVPMPPIMFKSADEIFSEVRTEFLEMMALGLEVLTAEELSCLSAKGRTNLETKMREVIQNEMGYADLDTFTGFDAVLRHYQRLPLTKYIDLHSEPVTRYRSYINSVFLHNSTGKHGFVIPRFTAKHPVENQRLREWETQVQAAYRKAWPKAQIHWINCDSMVPDMGFVHCMTLTVPAKP